MAEEKIKKAETELAYLRGKIKKKTTEKNYEKIRTKTFEELS